jgi:hypothetical protein
MSQRHADCPRTSLRDIPAVFLGEKHDLDCSTNGERWTLPIHIFDGIFFASTGKVSSHEASGAALDVLKEIQSKIENGFRTKALQRLPHTTLLNVDWYHTNLKPLMAKWVYFWLQDQRLHGISREEAEMYILEGGLAQSETVEHVGDIEDALKERESIQVADTAKKNEIEVEKKELKLALKSAKKQLSFVKKLFDLDRKLFEHSRDSAKKIEQLTEKSTLVQKRIQELETPRDDS